MTSEFNLTNGGEHLSVWASEEKTTVWLESHYEAAGIDLDRRQAQKLYRWLKERLGE